MNDSFHFFALVPLLCHGGGGCGSAAADGDETRKGRGWEVNNGFFSVYAPGVYFCRGVPVWICLWKPRSEVFLGRGGGRRWTTVFSSFCTVIPLIFRDGEGRGWIRVCGQ